MGGFWCANRFCDGVFRPNAPTERGDYNKVLCCGRFFVMGGLGAKAQGFFQNPRWARRVSWREPRGRQDPYILIACMAGAHRPLDEALRPASAGLGAPCMVWREVYTMGRSGRSDLCDGRSVVLTPRQSGATTTRHGFAGRVLWWEGVGATPYQVSPPLLVLLGWVRNAREHLSQAFWSIVNLFYWCRPGWNPALQRALLCVDGLRDEGGCAFRSSFRWRGSAEL